MVLKKINATFRSFYLIVSHTLLLLYQTVCMSDQVNDLIGEVRTKALKFHSALQDERAKNENLEGQVAENEAKMRTLIAENEALKSEIVDLKEQIDKQIEPTIDEKSIDLNDEEIDELVKEIEFCIEQLKK